MTVHNALKDGFIGPVLPASFIGKRADQVFLKHEFGDGILSFSASGCRRILHQFGFLSVDLFPDPFLIRQGHDLHPVIFRDRDMTAVGLSGDQVCSDPDCQLGADIILFIEHIRRGIVDKIRHIPDRILNELIQIVVGLLIRPF